MFPGNMKIRKAGRYGGDRIFHPVCRLLRGLVPRDWVRHTLRAGDFGCQCERFLCQKRG